MRTIPFEQSWVLAETTVFDRLCNEMSDVYEGRGSRGALTDVIGTWALETGGGDATDTHAKCWSGIEVGGSIKGLWKDRDKALVFGGLVERAMSDTDNFYHLENVQWFRATQFPRIIEVAVEFPNNKSAGPVRAYEFQLNVAMIYNTTQAYEEGE